MIKTFKKLAVLLAAVFSLSLFSGIHQADAAYDDGKYKLPVTILEGNSNNKSKTNDYIVSPATLIVKDGKNLVQMTLKNSSWWKSFTVESKAVTVISDSNDTRVVQFEVKDLSKLTKAHIHIVVPDINYDSKYDIRLKFDTSNLSSSKSAANTDNSTSGEKVEENPPTGDNAPILMLTIALLASGVVLFRKLAFR